MAESNPTGADTAKALLQQGRLPEALVAAQMAARSQPDDLDTVYVLAVCQRYAGRHQDALGTLDELLQQHPRYARAWQEQGHTLLAAGRHGMARDAFRRAVELNPALAASWRELAALERASGHARGQAVAEAEYQRLSALPPVLVSVASLIHEGRLFQAESLCRSFLKSQPRHVEAMRLLAQIGIRLSIYDDAEFLLESAVAFAPDDWRVRFDYVNILHRRHKHEQALAQAEALRHRFPGNLAFELAWANENVALGRFDDALAVYDRVIADHPDMEQPYLSRGHALKTLGRLEDGIESYRGAYRARPDFGDAYWSLANLKTYRFTDAEIEQMQAQAERSETAEDDRFHLCFALGKAFEDREDYPRAFHYYERGNRLKQASVRYDPDAAAAALRRQAEVCTRDLFARSQGFGTDAPDPIFIVGLPRAGSTLLEQILASHSEVDGTMELPNIIALAHRLNGRRMVDDDARYPSVLTELSADQCREFGERYIEETRVHRQGAPRFIDKMPNNFQHIGLIHLILPNARIIDARRHPMACCFSGFKQLFADGQEFSYGLDTMARHYRGYVELMDHWDEVLPGKVLRVHYEQVVADLDQQVHRLLEFLGLPFEPACLAFHQTRRSVRTPSSEQVRQPIYRSGVDQWRRFESELEPLRLALGDLVDEYPLPDAD